jgi:hypothetical protein
MLPMLALNTVEQVSLLVGVVALIPPVYVMWFGIRGGAFFSECGWRSWGRLIQSDMYAAVLEWFHHRYGPKGVRLFMVAFGAMAAGGIIALTLYNLHQY